MTTEATKTVKFATSNTAKTTKAYAKALGLLRKSLPLPALGHALVLPSGDVVLKNLEEEIQITGAAEPLGPGKHCLIRLQDLRARNLTPPAADYDPDEFPVPAVPPANIDLDRLTPLPGLPDAIRRAAPCVSDDHTRYTLTHVALDPEHAAVVATDGRALLTVPCPALSALPDTVLLRPTRGLLEFLASGGPIPKLCLTDSHKWLIRDRVTYVAPRAEGRYADWQSVIPSAPRSQYTLTAEHARHLSRLCGAAEDGESVILAHGKAAVGPLTVRLRDYQHENGALALDPQYLALVLDALDPDQAAAIHPGPDETKPMKITQGDLTALVMPIRPSPW